MKPSHKSPVTLTNPLQRLVARPYYEKAPSKPAVLEALLAAMSEFTGTCWDPVSGIGPDRKPTGYYLMLNQCPGACGHVWRLRIKDADIAAWLVNEINQRRHGKART